MWLYCIFIFHNFGPEANCGLQYSLFHSLELYLMPEYYIPNYNMQLSVLLTVQRSNSGWVLKATDTKQPVRKPTVPSDNPAPFGLV